jgi:hypothetical protein
MQRSSGMVPSSADCIKRVRSGAKSAASGPGEPPSVPALLAIRLVALTPGAATSERTLEPRACRG